MTPDERRKAIKFLNDKRASLRNRGADPANVSQYFGGNGAFVNFSKLSDSQLKRFEDRVKSSPRVTVVNGSIYPINYVKNREYLEQTEGKQPLVRDYERALKSPLTYQTNKEYKKYRAKIERETRQKWKKEVKDLYGRVNEKQERLNKRSTSNPRVKEILDFIDTLSYKDFTKFLDVVDSRLGFSAIQYSIIQKGLLRDIDDDIETFDRISHELDVLYSLYQDFIS